MEILSAIAVAFLVASVCVIALARSSTARWEQEKRSARAPRREVLAPPVAPRRATARLHGGPARLLSGAAVFGPIRALRDRIGRWATARSAARFPRGAVRRRWGDVRSVLVGRWNRTAAPFRTHEGTQPVQAAVDGTEPGEPEPAGEATVGRGHLHGRVRGQGPRRGTRRLPRRLAARLVHRHAEPLDREASPPGAAKR